jgi:hypothetical protein
MSSPLPGTIARYLSSLQRIDRQTEATPELSLREPLFSLAERDGPRGWTAEPACGSGGIRRTGGTAGYLREGRTPLGGFRRDEGRGHGPQSIPPVRQTGRRYRESLPNWVATDYHSFVFLREGEVIERAHVDDPHRLVDAFVGFFSYAPPVIRSSRRLAQELARRARLIRQGLEGVLGAEPPGGPLRNVLGFYRQTLMDQASCIRSTTWRSGSPR